MPPIQGKGVKGGRDFHSVPCRCFLGGATPISSIVSHANVMLMITSASLAPALFWKGKGGLNPGLTAGPIPAFLPQVNACPLTAPAPGPGAERDPGGERDKERPQRWSGDGQPHHRHNHQHQNALWKRQIPPRLVPATLQLGRPRPPALRSWAGGWERLRRKGEWGAGAGKRLVVRLSFELGTLNSTPSSWLRAGSQGSGETSKRRRMRVCLGRCLSPRLLSLGFRKHGGEWGR